MVEMKMVELSIIWPVLRSWLSKRNAIMDTITTTM
jgi:hypothetical protein